MSETFARTFFDGTAVGRRFRWAGSPANDPGVEIIGIVSDIKYRSVRAPSPALVYVPVMQDPVADATLYVRSTLPASAILTIVRQEITRLDPGVAPFNVRTLDRQVDESLATERGLSFLATALGLLALVLTSVGLAASIAQMITRRTREIGIRLALGASPQLVRRRVVLEGLLPAFLGGALGMLLAYPATHSLVGMLFGVSLTRSAGSRRKHGCPDAGCWVRLLRPGPSSVEGRSGDCPSGGMTANDGLSECVQSTQPSRDPPPVAALAGESVSSPY